MDINKSNCIRVFNSMIRGTPVSFDKELLVLFCDYLQEHKIKNIEKLVAAVQMQPDLLKMAMPKIVDYYCRKYNIFSLKAKPDPFLHSLNSPSQTILYYE